jgi:serine/threonine protein phosphatase PrpC
MLDLEFAELTDRGLNREHNEDYLGHVLPASPAQVQSQGWLFALADGVGGHERGEVASRLAIETMLAGFRKIPKGIMHVSLLPRLVQEANPAVYDKGAEKGASGRPWTREGRSMRTPAAQSMPQRHAHGDDPGGVRAALRFRGGLACGRLALLSVRNGAPQFQLTRDHTMADEQVRLGIDLQGRGGDRREPARADALAWAMRCSWPRTRSR